MGQLSLRHRPVDSLFELIGGGRRDENAATAALGWCMARAYGFLEEVAAELGAVAPGPAATVSLQEHAGANGITDVEVADPGRVAWIFEAKVGFAPPGNAQLKKYASRLASRADGAAPLLVVIARSDRRELYLSQAVGTAVGGIPLRVLSWGQVRSCAGRAQAKSDNAGKRMLRDLIDFLGKVIPMQPIDSNMAFVVSISDSSFGGGTTTFKEVVLKRGMYFHPVGGHWPIEPPNYMAFRWEGRLQSIHHVEVRTGDRIRQAARVWAAIDLLLTCKTISDAWQRTNERVEAAKLKT